jgi:hypothetical protein
MPDYNNGKIYTIRCRDDESLIYVGSTTQKLSQRWTDHKSKCKNENSKAYNMLIYSKMRETGQDKFYMELYEDYPCERKEQLEKREGEIMREIKSTLNKCIPGSPKVTKQQYYDPDKYKNYYIEHREEILERHKEYNKTYCRKPENRVKSTQYAKEKIECICGCIVRRDSLSTHKTTSKHNKLMN